MKLGLLLVRAVVGALFFGHGMQKLTGWFGGYGPDGTGGFFESLGLKPGKRNAIAAGAAEAGGGVLLAAGLFTPLAAAAVTGVMATAIRTVHLEKGPWVTDGGYEYNAVLIAIVTALADTGPGDWSLDHALGTELKGPAIALAALAAGVGGSHLLIQQAQGQPDATQAPPVAGDPSTATAQPATAS